MIRYKDIKFRNENVARWGVFFHALKIDCGIVKPIKEIFNISPAIVDGSNIVDFYLPESDIFVKVSDNENSHGKDISFEWDEIGIVVSKLKKPVFVVYGPPVISKFMGVFIIPVEPGEEDEIDNEKEIVASYGVTNAIEYEHSHDFLIEKITFGITSHCETVWLIQLSQNSIFPLVKLRAGKQCTEKDNCIINFEDSPHIQFAETEAIESVLVDNEILPQDDFTASIINNLLGGWDVLTKEEEATLKGGNS